jgi:hypothetical protein
MCPHASSDATRGRGIGTEHPWWVAVTVVMAKGQSGQRQWLTVCVGRHEHSAASHDCGGCLRSACGAATCHATCTSTGGEMPSCCSHSHVVVFLSPLHIYRKTDGLYAQGEILTVKSEAGQWYSGARLPRSLQQLVSALYCRRPHGCATGCIGCGRGQDTTHSVCC